MNRPEPMGGNEMSNELNKIMGMVCERERMYYNAAKVDALIAEKDAEIESLKASHYAEMVDAGMRERRLKRALWLKRADNASRIECMFRTLSDIEDDDTRTFWIFGNKWESVFYHLRCHRMKTAYDWTMIWENVECKCRAKAEEYK